MVKENHRLNINFLFRENRPCAGFFVGEKGGFSFVKNKSLGSNRHLSFSLLSKTLRISIFSFSFYSFIPFVKLVYVFDQ